MPIRTPKPPAGWRYGVILVNPMMKSDRVMYVKMAEDNGSMGNAQFEGITVKTDAYGKRIGRLHRLDRFNASRYKIDEP